MRTKQKRISLYRRGNTRCPICLSSFTELDVEDGKSVTLEHVPPRSFNLISRPMCLTCADCNNRSGRSMEQAAVTLMRRPKAKVDVGGVLHTAYLSRDEDDIFKIVIPHLRISPKVFLESKMEDFKTTFKMPSKHYASVSWLKAAYLSVFSLLGKCGYRYAESNALCLVRKQIMNPEDRVIEHFAFRADRSEEMEEMGCILMNLKQRPCWAVKMGVCVVLLPRSSDMSFYDDAKPFLYNGRCELGGGFAWPPVDFGKCLVASFSFDEGYSPEKQLGPAPFGKEIRVERNGSMKNFAVADYSGQDVTILSVQ